VTLKIAVLAPIPKARVNAAVAANVEFFRQLRHAYLKSLIRLSIELRIAHPRRGKSRRNYTRQ
jgi:hypothetical protein